MIIMKAKNAWMMLNSMVNVVTLYVMFNNQPHSCNAMTPDVGKNSRILLVDIDIINLSANRTSLFFPTSGIIARVGNNVRSSVMTGRFCPMTRQKKFCSICCPVIFFMTTVEFFIYNSFFLPSPYVYKTERTNVGQSEVNSYLLNVIIKIFIIFHHLTRILYVCIEEVQKKCSLVKTIN